MRRPHPAAVSFLFLTITLSAMTHPQQERDLKRYVQGGTFELHIFQDHPQSYAAKHDSILDFLWTNWQLRRLAYMFVKRYPIDQPPNTTYYYLEPDNEGTWHLLMRIERLEPDPKHAKRVRHVTEELHVYQLQRAELKKDAQDNWILIPPNDKRDRGTYALVISDKNGKSLGYQ